MNAILAALILLPIPAHKIEAMYIREARFLHAPVSRHEARCFSRIVWKESRNDPKCRTGHQYFGLGQLGRHARKLYGGNTTNPREQIRAMIRYVKTRYGRPSKAWSFWRHHRMY